MSSPSSTALQCLSRLHSSSPDFPDRLCNVLYGQEYVQCKPDLEHDDLVWLIEYLDQALGCLDPSVSASRKCLRELRSICGTKMILPASYTLSSDLLKIDPEAFASGTSGDVYLGTLRGSRICVKRIRAYVKPGSHHPAETFCQEAVTWRRLKHPNVLPLLGVTITPLQLISDWVSGGDLLQYIQRNPHADRLGLLSDIAKGLRYLHSCNVIHGDLKGLNILVRDSGSACLVDFGLAKVTRNLDSIQNASCLKGYTPRWAAPEVLEKEEYSKEADIFSFAMVMIEVFTGAVPFDDHSAIMAMLYMTLGKRPPRPTHKKFTEELWTLMQRCWHHDPHSRPEVSEILQVLLTLNLPSWKRLIDSPLSMGGRTALITTIFSDCDEIEVVGRLSGDDAQSLIDTIDKALDSLTSEIRRRCLHFLSSICGRLSLLPKSLPIPLCYNPTEALQHSCGFADVWKDEYNGQEVAVKVLRLCTTSDLDQVRRRFYKEAMMWRTLRHPNVLSLLGVTMTCDLFVMVSEWLENGNINEFMKACPDTNRLYLLVDVTKGLIYMHDRGIIHGNLNGSNILIDNEGHARLAGFSLLTIVPDELVASLEMSSPTPQRVGNVRWSAPEVLSGGATSKEADIFSLGMVMFEVFTSEDSFGNYPSSMATSVIMRGSRPPRPTHTSFTEVLWELMQSCWDEHPSSRPEASEVLKTLLSSDPPTLEQLVDPNLSASERIDLIMTIFSNHDKVEAVKYLSGDGAQDFVDAVYEALDSLDSLPPEIGGVCLRSLCEICGREALLPKSLLIPLCYDPKGIPQCGGGLVDVWKGEHDGQEVAAKVLKLHTTSDLDQVRRRFRKEVMTWKTLCHPNVLPLLGVTMADNLCQFAMVSEWMANGNINEFLERVDADRLKLLADVTEGLIYLHRRGIVHGDLKGVNIMIDRTCCAVLADFGLIALIPDQSTFLSTCIDSGSTPWMSPELLGPEDSGSRKRRPTKESDYYALGMVIYEVLSGHTPFHTDLPLAIPYKVQNGERPKRPQGKAGELFSDNIWDTMELCWKAKPNERASAKDVLLCLKGDSSTMDRRCILLVAAFSSSRHFSNWRGTAKNNPSLLIAPNKDTALAPPPNSPASVLPSPAIPQGSSQPTDPSPAGNSKKGVIRRWFKAAF